MHLNSTKAILAAVAIAMFASACTKHTVSEAKADAANERLQSDMLKMDPSFQSGDTSLSQDLTVSADVVSEEEGRAVGQTGTTVLLSVKYLNGKSSSLSTASMSPSDLAKGQTFSFEKSSTIAKFLEDGTPVALEGAEAALGGDVSAKGYFKAADLLVIEITRSRDAGQHEPVVENAGFEFKNVGGKWVQIAPLKISLAVAQAKQG